MKIWPETLELIGDRRPRAGGAYDGADRHSRELMTWQVPLLSADREISSAKGTIDARSRDATRNDAFVSGAVNYSRDSVVGAMFMLSCKPAYKVLGLDEVWAEEYSTEVETKFTLWAESAANWVDASRMNNFTSLIRLIVGIYAMSGEFLSSVEWLRDGGASRPYSTAINLISVDRLSNPQGQTNTRYLTNGVVKNDFGAPTAYWIRQAHQSEFNDPLSFIWKMVPIRKPWGRIQMIHVVDQNREGQSRGVSDMVSALKEHRMTKKFRDIVLMNAIVNSSYAASVESELPEEAVFETLGGKGGSASIQQAIADYAVGYWSAIDQYAGSAKNITLDGVKIPHLFPGSKLSLQPAGKGGPLGGDFEKSLLRYMSAALGMSYEEFSNDYSQSNYSSIRAAMSKTWKTMQARKRKIADTAANHIFALWLEEAINAGEITSLPRRPPSFYEGLNKEAYTLCEWVGASRGQIDELKETQAAVLRMDNLLSTHEDELARLGKDWRKIYEQRAREVKEMDRLGIQTNSSSMMNAVSGGSDPNAANPDGSGDQGGSSNGQNNSGGN